MLTAVYFIVGIVLVSKIYAQFGGMDPLSLEELEFNDIANTLALNLFNVMQQRSLVASTLMVRLPLIKLAGVANGDTKSELMKALGYNNVTWMLGAYRRLRENIAMLLTTDLVYVNKIYVNLTGYINPYFFANSEYEYGVKVESVAFKYPVAVVAFINKWMSQLTLRRITEVIDVNDIDANTSMVIVNGVHFKATWEFPFNYARTKLEPFHYVNGSTSQMYMMLKVDFFEFVDTGEYQAIKMRLLNANSYMIFILPHAKEALPMLLDKMHENPKYLTPFLSRMRGDKPLVVKIPRFKIKTYVDWTGFLQEMGVQSIFNCSTSDLSGMFKPGTGSNGRMCLNKVKQKVFLEIDEMGARRKVFSYTEDGAIRDSMADARLDTFREVAFNRPFLFTVNIYFSEVHNHELLTGVFYGPE